MKKFLAAGLTLAVASTAAARPLNTDPADAGRPVEADRAAPARRPMAPGQVAVGRPLEPGWVAADAMWLIHLDVGAFKNSTIGRFVLEHPEEFDLDDLDEFEQEVGLHPLTDFMSFTLYGFSDDPETDGVVVAVTSARADEALARLKAHEEVDSAEVNLEGFPVLVLSDGGERHYLHVRPADRRDQRIVVLAESEEVLLRAIKVIDGIAPGLSAGRSSILDGGPNRGSIVFVACGDIEALGGVEPASEILRLSDGVTIDIGEAQGHAYGEATVSATSPENATSIAEVAKGMIALGRLIATEEPQARPLADLANAINVGVHDQKITVRISFDAEQLMWILGALDEF
jgi:hypothetical protein